VVFDLKRFSVHDGPGLRTTVFFKGCPLNCWWCHNPEGQAENPELVLRPDRCIGCGACVDACANDAIVRQEGAIVTRREWCTACGACVDVCYPDARVIVGKRMTVDQVMEEIERDVPFYDQSDGGVTISGGEPLAQPEFLNEILRACKQRGLHTALDTCGFAPWADLDGLRSGVDLFLYDLKLMDAERHRECAGVTNEPILDNLQRLSARGHRIVLRVPVIPGVNDDNGNLQQIGHFAAQLPSLERVDLLPYHRIGHDKYRGLGKACTMPDTLPPSDGRMVEVAQTLQSYDLRVTLGG